MLLPALCMILLSAATAQGGKKDCHTLERFHALKYLHWEPQDWILAFRLTAGVQQSAYANYMDSRIDHDHPLSRFCMPKDCLRPSGPCDRHYHSSILNHWPSHCVDKVRVELFKGSKRVVSIIFNGKNSDKLSWFSKNRVLSSTYTDLKKGPFNYFSIPGHHISGRHSRRFFIFRNYGGCANDAGWISVQDVLFDACDWGKLKDRYPAILYSTKRTFVNFNRGDDVKKADVMTIAVKLSNQCRY